MKLPKTVQIGGFRFKVLKVERIDDNESEGECSVHKKTLLIKEGMGETEFQVFLHEVVHAIGIIYCADTLTEQQVESISQGLFQVVQDLEWIK